MSDEQMSHERIPSPDLIPMYFFYILYCTPVVTQVHPDMWIYGENVKKAELLHLYLTPEAIHCVK